jgi:quercetin 2,3-dioxygenase
VNTSVNSDLVNVTSEAGGPRLVQAIVPSEAASDGAGVRLRRAIGTSALPEVGPFLLLDEIHSDDAHSYIAGFPPHPHRGFETVTYMLSGQMQHQDSTGGKGIITSGDVQWMTAGSGVIHSEMPAQHNGLMWGFQLWLNLPRSEKMRAPEYIELKASAIPEVARDRMMVRVIAGSFEGVSGPAPARSTQPLILDARMTAGAHYAFPVPLGHDCFAYVYAGEIVVSTGDAQFAVPAKSTVQLSSAGTLQIVTATGASFLVVAGRPLNEPVARAGPFVMNSAFELQVAISDYRAGRLVQA